MKKGKDVSLDEIKGVIKQLKSPEVFDIPITCLERLELHVDFIKNPAEKNEWGVILNDYKQKMLNEVKEELGRNRSIESFELPESVRNLDSQIAHACDKTMSRVVAFRGEYKRPAWQYGTGSGKEQAPLGSKIKVNKDPEVAKIVDKCRDADKLTKDDFKSIEKLLAKENIGNELNKPPSEASKQSCGEIICDAIHSTTTVGVTKNQKTNILYGIALKTHIAKNEQENKKPEGMSFHRKS